MMTQTLVQEPDWKLERKGSSLLLRRDSLQSSSSSSSKKQRVCFSFDVEVREYDRDDDYYHCYTKEVTEERTIVEPMREVTSSPLAMCASCLAALAVTVVLPWLLMGG